jgi:hypothetical protein
VRTLAADVVDEVGELALEAVEQLQQVGAGLGRVLDEVVLLDDLQEVARAHHVDEVACVEDEEGGESGCWVFVTYGVKE